MNEIPDDGGPAFPRTGIEFRYADGEVLRYDPENGMSLRDWFAGQAISPMLMQAYGSTPKFLAMRAYEIADAMIAARETAVNAPPNHETT